MFGPVRGTEVCVGPSHVTHSVLTSRILSRWSIARVVQAAHYVSVMDFGARYLWLAPFNSWLTTRVMPVALYEARVKRNLEEVEQPEFCCRRCGLLRCPMSPVRARDGSCRRSRLP